MAKHVIKFEGIYELEKGLQKRLNMDKVKAIVQNNTAQLQKNAKENAPVGTPASTGIPGYVGGTLKHSIDIELEDGGMTGVVEPTAEYGAYVELGTRFMPAKPYLKPAWEEQIKKFKADMDNLVK